MPTYLNPEVLSRAEALGMKARQVVEGLRVGDHKSPYKGFSVEFVQHREYVPGDDIRHIDWKSYGRSERYTIKQYEQETNFVGHILLDASRSMLYGTGESNKQEYAKLLAASLAYLIIHQRDSASLAVFGSIAAMTTTVERRQHGRLVPERADGAAHWLRGPWPLVAGAIGLAAVNIATLVIGGRPWGVTGAFALWGAKAAAAIGIPVETWPYWQAPGQAAALRASVVHDPTSVMNVGIMLGALAAALLAGRFAPAWKVPGRSLAAAVIGGLLLGYGARAAYGCNIGAYFSGIASGSLHGWLWLPAAFAGNIAGTGLRPLFGLGVERTPRC